MLSKFNRSSCLSILLLCCLLASGLCEINALANNHKQKSKNGMKRLSPKESPFACNMAALTSEQRTRIFGLLKKMKLKMAEVKELPDGFAFRFPSESEMLIELAEFVSYERMCCPFFDFELTVAREGGPLWLKLKGREGVKDFIRMEFSL